MAALNHRSMAAGEISPRLGARSDVVKYQAGMGTVRNFIITREGAAMNRAGFEFVCPRLGFGSGAVRLIGFVFNNAQAYAVILQDLKVFFISDGFPVTEATKVITGITAANPPVVTSVAHGFSNGDVVYIENVGGMTEVNGRFFVVGNVAANTYELKEEANVNGAAYTAYTAGGTARRVYSLTIPYVASDLSLLRYAQSADVMLFTHPSYPVRTLIRGGSTWATSEASFGPSSSFSPPAAGTVAGTAGAVRVRYQVTAVHADTYEESYPGLEALFTINNVAQAVGVPYTVTTNLAHGYTTGDQVYLIGTGYAILNGLRFFITVTGATTFTIDGTSGLLVNAIAGGSSFRTSFNNAALVAPSVANPVTVSWGAGAGATPIQYKIYREINGLFGYIGTSVKTSFVDLGYTIDPQDTPPIFAARFSTATEYPRAVCFYQQRLLLGGPSGDPEATKAGRIGQYYNFTQSSPIQSDDSFTFTAAANQVNAIQHYVEMERLFIMTQGGEITVEGDDAGSLTPTTVNARKRSDFGISDTRPMVISQSILFIQTGARVTGATNYGNVILEISSGAAFGSFATRDLTTFSSHLFEGFTIVDWSYMARPYSVVWSVRNDGQLLGMTYQKDQDVLGWHRHDTGNGDLFTNVCTIPEGKETAVYATVTRRNVNGQTRTYIERMASRVVLSIDQTKCLDSFRTFDSLTVVNTTPGNTYTLTQINATDWKVTAAGALTFTVGDLSPDIGKLIAFHLSDGRRIRVRIGAVIDATNAYVDVQTDLLVITELTAAATLVLPYTSSNWSLGSTVIRGMWHLEGRTVYALSDGYDEGPYVVTLGAVTLAQAGSLVHVGLQIVADLETLPPDDPQSATLVDKAKTVAAITVQVEKTDGLKIGVNLLSLNPWKLANLRTKRGQVATGRLNTGTMTVPCAAKTDFFGTVTLRQDRPLPVTVLGITPTMTAGGS